MTSVILSLQSQSLSLNILLSLVGEVEVIIVVTIHHFSHLTNTVIIKKGKSIKTSSPSK